jgi:hypothetical protein
MLFVQAKEPMRVAVIDSGFNPYVVEKLHRCDNLQVKSFGNPTTYKQIEHGTNVAGLIEKYAKNKSKFCFILIRGLYTTKSTIESIRYAILMKANIINYSGTGKYESKEEHQAILDFLNTGGKFFTATGNDSKNLDKECSAFPACYSSLKINVITNRESYSNKYSKAFISDKDGKNENVYDTEMTGTSQSTAIETGRFINESN